MGKKNKKGKNKKEPAWKRYVSNPDSKTWKKKSDYKASKKQWGSGAKAQRSPAGLQAFKIREAAYKDARAARKNDNRNRKNNRRNNEPKNYDRNSGEFKDIVGAMGQDRDKGYKAARDLSNKRPSSGGNNDVIDRLNKILEGGLAGDNTASTGGSTGGSTANVQGAPSDVFEELLAKQARESQQQIADINAANAEAIAGIQSGFDSRISGLSEQMKQQMAAADAALAAANKRATNMRNAFVPQANPSALSIAYGDQRTMQRRAADNKLSDLKILSGLGTVSNPLAGLQLA